MRDYLIPKVLVSLCYILDSIRYNHVRKHQSPDMPRRTHLKCFFCWSFDRDRPTGRDHNSVTSEDRVSKMMESKVDLSRFIVELVTSFRKVDFPQCFKLSYKLHK